MRKPVGGAAIQRSRIARPATIPAPTGGWDATSPLPEMKPDRAVILENFFPKPANVELRKGFAEHATGVGTDAVETVMAWEGPSSSILLAASGTKIYDVTAAGAASEEVTGLTNARLQHTMFRTSGGNFLFWVNGDDDPQYFDGSTWTTPTINNITAAVAIHITAHKRRLWLTLKDSTKAAYLAADSIAGDATVFDFGALFTDGGYLVCTATWTLDGGDGQDDYFVAISSRGQVAVYQGTDPAAAATWALVGVFKIGTPIGRRCVAKVGADLAIVTMDGVLPLAQSLVLDRQTRPVAITREIQDAMNAAARSYSANFGWQFVIYPKGTMALLNVPTTQNATAEQYVMNSITGAWCKFTGMNACAWGLLGDDLYFGGTDGTVYKADSGTDDNGASIPYDIQTAWNYLGGKGQLKQAGMMATLLGTDGAVSPAIELLTDFRDRIPIATSSFVASSGTLWDASNWDVPDWASGVEVIRTWNAGGATGSCVSVRVKGLAKGVRMTINSWDLTYTLGAMV